MDLGRQNLLKLAGRDALPGEPQAVVDFDGAAGCSIGSIVKDLEGREILVTDSKVVTRVVGIVLVPKPD